MQSSKQIIQEHVTLQEPSSMGNNSITAATLTKAAATSATSSSTVNTSAFEAQNDLVDQLLNENAALRQQLQDLQLSMEMERRKYIYWVAYYYSNHLYTTKICGQDHL